MECIKCKAPVSQEQMDARREAAWKQGMIVRLVPMCEECRNKPAKPYVIKRVN